MAFRAGLITVAVVVLALVGAGPATAERVLVLGKDGSVHARQDPIPRGSGPRPSGKERKARATASARKRTVRGELKRMLDAGAIDQAEHDERRGELRRAEDLLDRLSGGRAAQLAGALRTVETMAAQGSLTVGRLEPLWRILDTNVRWANEGPLLAPGQRVSLEGSELVYQYVAGHGLQLHPLANAGKLNDLWKKKRTAGRDARIQLLLDELLALAAERGGGTAWEYYFPYSGRAPWVSGMAQATMLQATSRASIRLGIRDETWPLLKAGLGVFQQPPPTGVRVATANGVHYALYSQRPNLRVLNGFAQALVGLYDFGAYANDDDARALFAEGDRELQQELPTYDTGAWSLYSRVEVTRESDLGYHRLTTGFLEGLCERTLLPAYCGTRDRFNAYLATPPVLSVRTERLRGGRTGRIWFRLSKISRVSLRLSRGTRTVFATSSTVGYGKRAFSWTPPNRARNYVLALTATDLAGNTATFDTELEVVRGRKK
jgi:hypothetical protein